MPFSRRPRPLQALVCLIFAMPYANADPVAVRHRQGEVHAFLQVRSDSGKLLGSVDEVNVPDGSAWKNRLTMRFVDGSMDEETAVYTQGKAFHLISDHLVMKGPSFKDQVDMFIDTAKNEVSYHEQKGGKDQVTTEHMDLPPDLANGIMPMLLQNFPHGAAEVKVGYVATMPKPRLVSFAIHSAGRQTYHVGPLARPADRYRIHIEIGA